MKNEEKYIVEWIEYYLNLGFDKVYIYNNDDNQLKLKILIGDKYKEKVIVIDYSGKKSFQISLYNEIINTLNYKWCAIFDCDEFLELRQHNNIKEYLNEVPDDITSILFSWLCYGTCGNKKYKPGKIFENYPIPKYPIDELIDITKSKTPNVNIKSMHKKVNYKRTIINPHCCIEGVFCLNNFDRNVSKLESFYYALQKVNYDYAILHHFFTRSKDEYFNKKIKSRPDTKGRGEIKKYLELFDNIETNEITQNMREIIQTPPLRQRYNSILVLDETKIPQALVSANIIIYMGDLTNNLLYMNCAYCLGVKYYYHDLNHKNKNKIIPDFILK